jgi:hypothetical protein
MALRITEDPKSRSLEYGAQNGGQTLSFNVVATAGETETDIWLFALLNSSPYFNGFIRNNVKVDPQGGTLFGVTITYGTTGVGGGDQPLGGEGNDGGSPTNPSSPASDSTPLTSGYSFSISCPRIHYTQSRQTISSTKRGGGVAPDWKGAIGIDTSSGVNKIQGADWPPDAAFSFSRTFARATVTQGYLETLALLAGRPNNAEFYGFDEGEVILLQADGQFTQGEGWSITMKFGVSLNDTDIVICDGLTVPEKLGWNYLWVLYADVQDGNDVRTWPEAAYVEEILRPVDFSLLEIG